MFGNVYSGKTILVTGHTGFKGTWLCHWLKRLGARVSGVSIDVPTDPSMYHQTKLKECLEADLRGDIRVFSDVQKAFAAVKPEIVFHLAAQPIVTKSYKDPVETFATNSLGTVHVLECIRNSPGVLASVIVTSDKAYENVEWEYGYRESDRLGGHDPYSASKACAEIAFSSYFRSFFSKSGSMIASARAGNVIGGGDFAADRIVPDAVRAWTLKKAAGLRNPYATRPWQHVLEPLSGYLQLGEFLVRAKGGITGEAFNFGPSSNVIETVQDLVKALTQSWPGALLEQSSEKFAIHEAGLLKLCCDKAKKRLGWNATLNFEETAKLTAEWYYRVLQQGHSSFDVTQEQLSRFEGFAKERKASWADNELRDTV
jgi:CDP-glucose 4,6-dehydratase